MPEKSVRRDFDITADGIRLECRLTAPPRTSTEVIAQKILLLERFVQSPDQVVMEFDSQTVLEGVTLRTDKPKTGDRDCSVVMNFRNAPMTQRATLYNLAQTGKLVTVKVIEPDEPKSKKKEVADTAKAGQDATPEPPAETPATKPEQDDKAEKASKPPAKSRKSRTPRTSASA
jgi:hypothetical protein